MATIDYEKHVSEWSTGYSIPGVPSKVFCWEDECGRVTVSHVPTGRKLASFANAETACKQVRQWWRSLPGSGREHLETLTEESVMKAVHGEIMRFAPKFSFDEK